MVELKEKIPAHLTLLREKSAILDKTDGATEGKLIETIRSNRCAFNCGETAVVVRTKYMHQALRLSAVLYRDYHFKGAFDKRGDKTVDWDLFWLESQSAFDQEFDKIGWAQIFVDGENVYATHHSDYIDAIEKCSVAGELQSYDDSLGITERLFAEQGQHIEIIHSSTVSASIKEEPDHIRMGLIHRGHRRDTVFSVAIMNMPNKPLFHQVIDLSADFVEIINLSHQINAVKKKLKLSASLVPTSELHLARASRERRSKLEKVVDGFEGIYIMRYRPERPMLSSPDDYDF